MKNGTHVIFGTGPLGRSVMKELLRKEYNVRMVNRSGKATVPNEVEVVQADLLHGKNVLDAVQGASAVYQCANPPYDKWPEQFPTMQNAIVNAAVSVNARLIIGENLYMYGDTNGKIITEDLPYIAATRKGKVRAQMAMDALRAHTEGKLQVAIARAPDYFGPHVLASAMGERVFLPAFQGKAASLLGNIDLPHTFSFINDVGKALVTLAEHDEAFGKCWHVPNAETLSQLEVVNLIFAEIGKPPKIKVAGRTMLRFGGLFVPAAKEMVEMMYEFEKPFIVDSSKFEQTFGWKATDMKSAIRETAQWYMDTYDPLKR